jgi:hypothetical protein
MNVLFTSICTVVVMCRGSNHSEVVNFFIVLVVQVSFVTKVCTAERCDRMWLYVTVCDCMWPYVTVCDLCDCMWPYVAVCGCMWLYLTVCDLCDRMWLYVTVCGCMWPYVTVCGCMWLYVAVCDCMLPYVTVCDRMWPYVTVCDCMWLYVTTWSSFGVLGRLGVYVCARFVLQLVILYWRFGTTYRSHLQGFSSYVVFVCSF